MSGKRRGRPIQLDVVEEYERGTGATILRIRLLDRRDQTAWKISRMVTAEGQGHFAQHRRRAMCELRNAWRDKVLGHDWPVQANARLERHHRLRRELSHRLMLPGHNMSLLDRAIIGAAYDYERARVWLHLYETVGREPTWRELQRYMHPDAPDPWLSWWWVAHRDHFIGPFPEQERDEAARLAGERGGVLVPGTVTTPDLRRLQF